MPNEINGLDTSKHFHGHPCKKCGSTLRHTNGKHCVHCKKSRGAIYEASNSDKRKERNISFRKANTDLCRLYTARYRQKNLDKCREREARYRANNPAVFTANSACRRARRKSATPSWVDRVALSEFYKNRPEGYHVDHIVPLAGKYVCGLHVPWNLQYLTPSDNASKGNRFKDKP